MFLCVLVWTFAWFASWIKISLYVCDCINVAWISFFPLASFFLSFFQQLNNMAIPSTTKVKNEGKNKIKTKQKMKYAKEITPKTQNAVYLILNARHLNITLSSSRVIVSQSLLLGANNQLTSCCIVSLSNQRVFVCVRAGAVFVHWCVWSRNLIINVINLDMIKKDDQGPVHWTR